MKNALLLGLLIGLKVFSQNVIVNGKNIRIELTIEKNSKGYHTLLIISFFERKYKESERNLSFNNKRIKLN